MFFKKKEIIDFYPEIITFNDSIKVVGISVDTNEKDGNKDMSQLGKDFSQVKDSIKHKKEPWQFIAVSRGISKRTGAYNYFMGDVVISFEGQPEDLERYEIPQLFFAKITIKAKNRMSWGLEIINMKKHFYSVWLPNSKYKESKTIGEFEMHDERSRGKKPEMDMYFAVRKRG